MTDHTTPDAETLQRAREAGRDGVTLADLHAANIARQAEWCPDQVPDLSFRGNELGGECGEALNVIKKLERERLGWRGSRDTLEHLAEELADVVICADLCAVTAGIDLGEAVVAKFNATSEKVGLSTKLRAIALDRAAQSARETAAPVDGGEELRQEASFLLERLAEFVNEDLTDVSARGWYGHVEPSIARLKDLLAARPAQAPIPEMPVLGDVGAETRLWWYLTILNGMGGNAYAGDDKWNWLNTFCNDREKDPDTYNLAERRKLTRTTHNVDTSDSVVYLTPAGKAWLVERPTAPAPDQTPLRGGVTVEEIGSLQVIDEHDADLCTLRHVLGQGFESLGYGYYLTAADNALKKVIDTLSRQSADVGTDAWRSIESAPKDGTLIGVPGGAAYWRDGQWFTVTGEDWPGRPIQWPVLWWKSLTPPETPPAGSTQGETGGPV